MDATTTATDYIIRPLTRTDQPFLWEMLYYAIFIEPGQTPPPRDIVSQPELAKYVRDWGRSDDYGFIAIDAGPQRPVGAAWLRLLASDNRGYGYVNDATPELSIAVLPDHRGKGIGTRLLNRLLETSRDHYPSISLSVSANNPALRLYRRLGFEVVGESETSLTMIRVFDDRQ